MSGMFCQISQDPVDTYVLVIFLIEDICVLVLLLSFLYCGVYFGEFVFFIQGIKIILSW